MSAFIRIGHGTRGVERLEAHFQGQGFSPHRHDTYAVGITLSGVQTFRYRGAQRICLPKQCHVLHPDELHDGSAATNEGFGYRIVYVDPALVQQALGGRPLPFVVDPIVDLTTAQHRLMSRIWDMDEDIDELARVEIAVAIADILETVAMAASQSQRLLPLKSLMLVRDLLAANPAERRSLQDLERISGLDRWMLARHFRAAFGTSPTRFRTLRQLDEVRRLATHGVSLADAALEAGFSDQSHMSRKFKRAYGLTPGRWMAATFECSSSPS